MVRVGLKGALVDRDAEICLLELLEKLFRLGEGDEPTVVVLRGSE